MKRIITFLTVMLLLLTCFAGCKGDSAPNYGPQELQEPLPDELNFSKNGIHFTLPGDFQDHTDGILNQGYTFLYANGSWGIFGTEETKNPELYPDFSAFVSAKASAMGVEAVEKSGVWTLTYRDDTKNEPETCVRVFYQSESSYWTVTAYCREDVYDIYQEAMWNYVSSATFE